MSEDAITAWLAAQYGAMLAELERMVNTDGGSYDKAGVDAVGAQISGRPRSPFRVTSTAPQSTRLRPSPAAPTRARASPSS